MLNSSANNLMPFAHTMSERKNCKAAFQKRVKKEQRFYSGNYNKQKSLL
jgi:hypothetical protein